MRTARYISLLIFALLQAACVGGPAVVGRSSVMRDSLVVLATREVQRRNLPLPRNHKVAVTEGFHQSEIEPRRAIIGVSFTFPFRGGNDPVYVVWIDPKLGSVEVSDLRSALPLDPPKKT